MKKSMLLLVLISTVSFAQDIYCPQNIICTNGTCNPSIPDGNFYSNPGNYSNGTYSFIYVTIASSTVCAYVKYTSDNDPGEKSQIFSKLKVVPDLNNHTTNNAWAYSAGNTCPSVNEKVSIDTHQCPLLVVENK